MMDRGTSIDGVGSVLTALSSLGALTMQQDLRATSERTQKKKIHQGHR